MAMQLVVAIQLILGIGVNLFEFKKRNFLLAYLCFLIIYTYNIFLIYPFEIGNLLKTPLHVIGSYIYFGPTFYLYLKSITNEQLPLPSDFIRVYSLPFVICLFHNAFVINFYGLITIAFLIFYVIKCCPLFFTVKNKLQGALKNRFLLFFWITITYIVLDTPMLLIEDLAFLNINPFNNIYTITNDVFYRYIHFPLLFVHFFILSLYAITEIPRLKKYIVNRPLKDEGLSNSDINNLIEKLHALFNDYELFLKNDLTLEYVAKILNTDKNIISKLLKERYNKRFNEYVNSFRVDYFKKLVRNKEFENYDLLGLAKESGFKSKATFYRVFKEIEGQTPNAFKNKTSKN